MTFVDTRDEAAVTQAFRPETKLLVAETLSNPTLVVVADIPMLARVAHAHGAKLFIDNTFASPVLCRPLELGADIIMHWPRSIWADTPTSSQVWCSAARA